MLRCFECLLHISYRTEFKTWQVRNENKLLYNKRKVKPNFGTSNDGNTARKFFKNYEKSSEITGLNKDLIYNLGIILKTVASGKFVDIENFRKLTEETRTIYLENYSWFYMSSTLHKLLIHGCEIIKYFDLPIGNILIIIYLNNM